MSSHRLLAGAIALLLSAAACLAAPATPARDAAGDTLPEGALVRIGTRRLRHAGFVINVVFAPDGKALVSSGNDGMVRLWDTATGKEIRRFEGHVGHVDGLAFSPDGKTIISSGSDGTARLWDVATGKETVSLKGHTGMVNAAAFAPDGKTVATKGVDGTGRIWEAATGKELHTFPVARDNGSPLAFSPDGKTLAVVAQDLSLQLLDTTTAKAAQTFAGHKANLNSLDFSPDGKQFASAGGDSLARVWDVATGKEVLQLKGHEGVVSSVHFSPDGKLLATGGFDKTIRFWDAKTGEELRQGTGHTGVVSEVGFRPDGKVLASASWDNAVRLWDVATGKELPQSAGPGPVACAALSADGKLLVTGHAANGVHLWDAATGKARGAALDFNGPVTAVALTPDGKLVAAANGAGTFAVWDITTGKKLFLPAAEEDRKARLGQRMPVVLALAPDGKTLAVIHGEYNGGVDFHDPLTGKRLPSSPPHPMPDPNSGVIHFPPTALAFSPDGRTFLTASPTDGVKLHETTTGKEVRQLLDPSAGIAVAGIAYAPDGRSVAAGGHDGTVWVWETATGGERRKWQASKAAAPEAPVATMVAFSADGRLLATSDATGGIRVWHAAAGKELKTFTGHEAHVTALAFAPGGKMLSVSADGTALIWDTAGIKSDAKGTTEKIETDAAWAGLGDDSPTKAFEAMGRLGEAPEAAVRILRERLKPANAADAKRIEQMIAQLNDDDFEKREGASKELARIGPQAEKALRAAAKDPPSAEVARRVTELLTKIKEGAVSGEGLREARALEVLEGLGTPEAKKLLEDLAKGSAGAGLTQEAKAALERIGKRN
jgi:WD40 repeat protein